MRIYCAPRHRILRSVRNKCAPYLVLMVSALPASAWEFTPGIPCLLTHETPEVAVELTYDPTAPLYSISLSRDAGFAAADIFSITFVGPFPLTISTDQHRISADRRTLTVKDTGFGNVLNGLQANAIAVARLGTETIAIPLTGAEAPVAAFRACRPLAGV